MDSALKRRGFMKGKLMPLYRPAKPATNLGYNSKVIKPSQSSPSTASVNYVAPPKQEVSFMVPADYSRDVLSQFDKLFGVAGDETVDTEAASYISSVQERFKLERINSEQMMVEE